MAVVNQTLQDSRYRTIIKTTTTGTNANAEILDVSDLLGYMALRTSLVTIAKISWSLAAQTDILWDASTNVVAFSMNGSGTYGFMPGQPSLANNAAAANLTGDVLLTNGTSVGTIVIEYHKVSLASGLGWTWTDTVLGPPQNQFGG
mgnify:FL=1